MTGDEVKTLLDNIVTELNAAVSTGQALVPPELLTPQAQAYIAIAKAVDKQIPGLVAGVVNWIQGNLPTDAEKADLAGKIALLNDPNAP